MRAGREGAFSPEAEATPEGPPAAPQGLRVRAGHTQVSLAWDEVPGADGYAVYRASVPFAAGPLPAGARPVPGAENIGGAVWTDSGLSDGQPYYYRVVARLSAAHRAALVGRALRPADVPNAALSSPPSPPVSESPSATVPLAPASLTATLAADGGGAALAWESGGGQEEGALASRPDPSDSGVTYRVYRGTHSGGEAARPVGEGLRSPSLSGLALPIGHTDYYLVTAVNAAGESAYSPERAVAPAPPSGSVAVASALPGGGGGTPGLSPGGVASVGAGGGGAASAAPASPAAAKPAASAPGGVTSTGSVGSAPVQPAPPPSPGPPPGPSPPTPAPPSPAPPSPGTPSSPSPPGPISSGPGPSPRPPPGTAPSPRPPPGSAPGSPGGDLPPPLSGTNPSFYLTLASGQLGLRSDAPTTVTVTFVSQQGLLGQILPVVAGLPPGARAMFYPAQPSLTTVVDGHSVASTTLYLFGPSQAVGVGPYSVAVGATLYPGGSPTSAPLPASGTLTVYGN